MPIRINLKEIFPSDPQEINVEKVNFNFNKLLELGIGTPGPIGLTGPQGPAGPIGLTGPQGIRGATWWVDSDIPTTHTFTGLLDGDLYLDNLTFDVWRWDAATSTWTLEVGISTIINTYLAANGSPFVKDLKSLPSANIDGRFITFAKRNDINDITRGIGSASTNNSLFLTNFDETQIFTQPLIQWPPDVKSLYNSIVSIFANHSDNQVSTAADIGRYHLELGSLYNDSLNTRISEVQHNLKIKFIKDYVEFPRTSIGSWNDWINTAQFSLSVDETRLVTDIDQNGIFNFITPKFNGTIPASLIQDELYTRVGPLEAHAEIPNLDYVKADGISFELFHSSLGSNIGIASDYVSSYSRLDTKDLFMLDSNVNVYGTLINDDTYIIGNTNVIGKVSIGDIDPTSDLTVSGNASIGAGYNAIPAPTNGAIIEGDLGIGTSVPASKLTVSGNTSIGSGYGAISAPTDGAIVEGTIGVGTSSPDVVSKLHVNGKVKITDGTQPGAGTSATLTTSGDGLASWTPLSDVGVPVGAIVMWNSAVPPTGWLLCDGLAVDPVLYPKLRNLMTFTPNMASNFPIGSSTGYPLGTSGGVADVTLTSAQSGVPAHKHCISISGSTSCVGNHNHMSGYNGNAIFEGGSIPKCGTLVDLRSDSCGVERTNFPFPDGAHDHTVSVTGDSYDNIAKDATASHTNIPPYVSVNFIIKHD